MRLLVIVRQLLCARPAALYAAWPVVPLHMLQLVGKTVVIDALLHNLDFVADEDGAERLLDDGPEDGHGGADDGEVNFEAGEDDESW